MISTQNSEYDKEIPQSQTADKHQKEEPHNNRETPGRQTKQSNQLSLGYGHNPPRTKPPLLIFVYVDKIPPMNFTTRT